MLGDGLSIGENSYNETGYGYVDYIKEKIKINNYNNYAKSNCLIEDLLKEIKINNELKKDLRESNLLTISIGINDFYNKIDKQDINISNLLSLKPIINQIIDDLDIFLKELNKYAKQKVYFIGYYNPMPFLFNTSSSDLDTLFAYIDDRMNKITEKYNIKYISLYQLFKNNPSFLPNPSTYYPNTNGYIEIAKKILDIY